MHSFLGTEKVPNINNCRTTAGVMEKRILGEKNPTVCCVYVFSFPPFTDSARGMNGHRCSVFPKAGFTMVALIAAGKHLVIVRREHSGDLYLPLIAKFPGTGARTITLLFRTRTVPHSYSQLCALSYSLIKHIFWCQPHARSYLLLTHLRLLNSCQP